MPAVPVFWIRSKKNCYLKFFELLSFTCVLPECEGDESISAFRPKLGRFLSVVITFSLIMHLKFVESIDE